MAPLANFFKKKNPAFFPETSSVTSRQGMNLVAIDTMHLFPTTLECAKLVEARGAVYDTW